MMMRTSAMKHTGTKPLQAAALWVLLTGSPVAAALRRQ